jgi:hypothetical protein
MLVDAVLVLSGMLMVMMMGDVAVRKAYTNATLPATLRSTPTTTPTTTASTTANTNNINIRNGMGSGARSRYDSPRCIHGVKYGSARC